MGKNIALLILSCDNYADIWPIFFSQFERNWPDCPFDKYISTNFLSAGSDSFTDIKVGQDQSWSDGVMKALTQIKDTYEYALITLEDLILTEKIDNPEFLSMVSMFLSSNGNYLKFIRKPKPTHKFNKYFGEIKPGSLYRPTCVYALWKIETLLELLDRNEDAWQFERFGAIRSDRYNGFYVVYKDFFKISNTVIKGKWVPSEKRKIEKEGYQIKKSRKALTQPEVIKLAFRTFMFKLFTNFFPWKYRRQIVFMLKRYRNKKQLSSDR